MRCAAYARGLALVEALVALTLLTAGLAATAALTIQTLRQTREASCRTSAVRFAASLADDLRSFRCPDGRAIRSVSGMPVDAACDWHPSCCPMEQAAAARFAAWQAELGGGVLSGAAGRVEVVDPAIAAYRIRIEWPVAPDAAVASLLLPVET